MIYDPMIKSMIQRFNYVILPIQQLLHKKPNAEANQTIILTLSTTGSYIGIFGSLNLGSSNRHPLILIVWPWTSSGCALGRTYTALTLGSFGCPPRR